MRLRMGRVVGAGGEKPPATRLAGWQRRYFNLDTDHLWEDAIRFVSKTVLFLELNLLPDNECHSNQAEGKLCDRWVKYLL